MLKMKFICRKANLIREKSFGIRVASISPNFEENQRGVARWSGARSRRCSVDD
jgi:hypothetical protein